MTIELGRPRIEQLDEVVRVLCEWQHDGAPVPLHPGDLGWFRRFGASATADAVRTWRRDGRLVAVGLLDGPALVRLAIAPDASDDDTLAEQLAADVADPGRGVLPAGGAAVEARFGGRLRELLADGGWTDDEPWTPLRRGLAEPVEDCGLRIEVIGPERAHVWAGVHRAAFPGSRFGEDGWRELWESLTGGSLWADARCLVAHDDRDHAVAAAVVWSAGPGRPGLLEPVGTHPDHRGRGHGRAVAVAAAAALRELGSSSATVCTRSANVAAVATYASAGYERLPDVRDLGR